MGSLPALPALLVKTPEQPDPISSFQRLVAIKSLLGQQQGQQQEQQMRGLEIQKAQLSLADQQAGTKAMQQWDGQDFNDIPTLIKKKGESLNAVLDATQKITARQQQLATLTGDQLKNAQAQNDQYRGRLQSIVDAPADQKQALWQQEIAAEKTAGRQLAPGISDQYPGDAQVQVLSNHFALGSQLIKEANEKMTAQGALQRGQAATQQAGTAAQRLQLEAPALGGQVTPKDIYVQQQENYRSLLGRQATQSNELQRQGIASLQKQSDAYTQFLGTANSLKQSLAAAKTGNEMAAAVAPLQGTLFITTSEGVKRINNTELEGIAGAGSLAQRIEGALGKQTGKGPLSDSLKNDMASLVDLYTTAKYGSYEKQAQYTQKLHGLDPEKTPILDQGGNIAGLTPAGAQNLPNPAAHLPAGNGRVIDKATAQQFYQIAGGDPKKAMALAMQNGWKVQ
jgi:hypothetical protein